jgi:hypothetical protein
MGKYIYGVIDSGQAERFPLDGVVKFAPDATEDEQAYTVSWQDISAIVTESPVVDYLSMAKDALARLLVRHQQTIERVMPSHTVLPVRLGTCAENDEQVRAILARSHATVKDTLEVARSVVEVDVTATIGDFDSFLQRVSQSPEVQQLKQSFLHRPDGVTVEDRMKIGSLVKQQIDREKEQMSQQIHAAFKDLVANAKAHDLMDDRMVLNTAFLIQKDRQGDFDDRVEQLNVQFDDQLDFRRVGPLPPYSFYTLEVRSTDSKEVDWARQQLGLSRDPITIDTIKKAHRKVALTCHPDKNPDVPDIEKKFADMSRAYRILLDYCVASARSEQAEGFGGDEKTFEGNAVLVMTSR